MESAVEGELVMLKLANGEDVFGSLERACLERGVESGAVQWGIGMLQDFEIGFFAPGGYQRKAFRDPHELLAFHGSLAMTSEPKFHIHTAVAGPDHAVVGGHLFRAKACVVNEICLRRFDTVRLSRRQNPATGLKELHVE